MRRYLLSLIPTAAMLTVVIGACGSGNAGITTPSALPTIAADGNNWNTIATSSTTLSGAVVDPGAGGGVPEGIDGQLTYTIAAGDYWIKISKFYGCPKWEDIPAFNDLSTDPNVFPAVGTAINIPPTCVQTGAAPADPGVPAGATDPATTPAAAPVTASADGSFPYTVVANDTMFGIAKKFDVKMDALMAANGWTGDPANVKLYPDRDIKIPGAPAG
jgi:LysM repeat protein